MSNFTFIQADFPSLFEGAHNAERLVFEFPDATAVYCRSTLESAINWLYEHDAKLVRPYRADLSGLMHEHSFQSQFSRNWFAELDMIRKTGNLAAHGKGASEQAALASLKYLFRFLRYMATYYGKVVPEHQVFDETLIPHAVPQQTSKKDETKQLKKLQENLDHKNRKEREAEQTIRQQAQTHAELQCKYEQERADNAALK